MKEFTKDGATKIANTVEQEALFIAAGWVSAQEEPKVEIRAEKAEKVSKKAGK